MKKSRKFVIHSIDKDTRRVNLTMTLTTKRDMPDEELIVLIKRELAKCGEKYDHAWEILR